MSTKSASSFDNVLNVSFDNAQKNENMKLSCQNFDGRESNAKKCFDTLSTMSTYKISNDVNALHPENIGKKCKKDKNMIRVYCVNVLTQYVKENNVKTLTLSKGQEIVLRNEKFVLRDDVNMRIYKEKRTLKNPNPEHGIQSVTRIDGIGFLFVNILRYADGIRIKMS